MNISYITNYDAQNINKWSGLGYYISKSLKDQNNDIDYLTLAPCTNIMLHLKNQYYKFALKRNACIERDPYMIDRYCKQIMGSINKKSDILFAPSSIPMSMVEANKPKVFYTDCTFAGMVGFYDCFSNCDQATINNANYLEQKALESASLAIYSSDWAAQTAIDNYNVNPNKVKVVPFGANLERNFNFEEVKKIISTRSKNVCHLLFLGVDWKRKGGDTAIKVAEILNSLGIKTILHVAGIKKIPLKKIPDFVINHGFINKANKEGRVRIDTLLAQSHFLILPTLAEAYGLVFCEANSFGVPCISTNVGGITTIVKNNVNGMTFSLSDNPELYALYIHSVFTDKKRYNELALSSYNEYSQRLNWNVAGKAITGLLKEL